LVEYVGASMAGGFPLEETLHALAEDLSDRRLAAAADALATQIERGIPLEKATELLQASLPSEVRGLLEAAVRSGDPTAVFESFARERAASQATQATIRGTIAYPVIVLAVFLPIALLFSIYVIPEFQTIYEDFGLELPEITAIVVRGARQLPLFLAGAIAVPAVLLLAGRIVGGRWLWHRMRGAVPIVGKMYVWSGHRELAGLLASLLELRVPSDEAAGHVARMLADRNLARATTYVVRNLRDGMSLSEALRASIHFDRMLTALVYWGEQHNVVSEALRQASATFDGRIEQQATLVRRLFPPITLIAIATMVLLVVAGLMLPLVNILEGLM
jgi:type II secretory pathway component PulF